MNVLVVEDDPALSMFLKKGLELEGHRVNCVGDGEAALQFAATHLPELMVLDLGLPRTDGTEVLRAMHAAFPQTSILVLSGRSGMEERVQCLDAGADDYLQKPFSFHELTARCRAVIRRRSQFSEPVLSFAGLSLNLLERTALYEGRSVDLTTKEFLLVEALLRRKGECCTRAELLREVWPGTPPSGSNVVDVYITYLRRKFSAISFDLADAPLRQTLIETVRGAGYRINGRKAQSQALGAALPQRLA